MLCGFFYDLHIAAFAYLFLTSRLKAVRYIDLKIHVAAISFVLVGFWSNNVYIALMATSEITILFSLHKILFLRILGLHPQF